MTDGLRVNRTVTIPWAELELKFSPSGGPGGQHANRSSTRVDLAWNVDASPALGPRQRVRVRSALRNRIDTSGTLRLSSDVHRSQLRNREDVLRRLGDLVADALRPVRPRRKTSPSAGSVERRLRDKRRRAEIKRARRPPRDDI